MMMKLEKVLRDSGRGFSRFSAALVARLERRVTEKNGKRFVECVVRKKAVQLKPEEVVRQLFLLSLVEEYVYPVERIRVEYPVHFGREVKRVDIAIMDEDRPQTPYIVIEVKKPKERDGKEQLRGYCSATGAPIAVWTNGEAIICFHRKDPNYFEEIPDIPRAGQTLADILQRPWTLVDLTKNDKLVIERRSLKGIVESLEDGILANAGVDVFEEVFKLIFAKLYDEWHSGQDEETRKTRNLEFHNSGQTDAQLKAKIDSLFDKAKDRWQGVFSPDESIKLTPSHLAICIGSLEQIKLLNSNLDVVDDAFEYLINKEAKGDKGQYFTPRYVIDMCVKMLDPQADENLVDPAAGSSGFTIHSIFHVWRKILAKIGKKQSHLFTSERKPRECEDYAAKRVFAIDFDNRAVRVARAINLIAGDGQTNVLRLNTLDFKRWGETQNEEWRDIFYEGEKRLRRLRVETGSARDHKFDIVMANPPFAGDIRESEIITNYELGKKMERDRRPYEERARQKAKREGKIAPDQPLSETPTRQKGWHEKISRHILFIERNLQFLRPGGRMAIVLPQGVFNNVSDYFARDFIAERCRILAVVGLHPNTFKPHTGTKTSVLFAQKWNDDPKAGPLCPRVSDYNIFFATMQKSGKDNSGEKIIVQKTPEEENEPPKVLLDDNGHLIVDHDLFNLFEHHFGGEESELGDADREKIDAPGIAEAFQEFAKKEGLSFAKKP